MSSHKYTVSKITSVELVETQRIAQSIQRLNELNRCGCVGRAIMHAYTMTREPSMEVQKALREALGLP